MFQNFRNINDIKNCSEKTHSNRYEIEVLHYTNMYISRYFITTMEATVFKFDYFTLEPNNFNKLRRERVTLRHTLALEPTYRIKRNVSGIQIDQFTYKFKPNTHPYLKRELLYGKNKNCSIKPYSNQYTTDVFTFL